jgi:ATP-binding cassette subfamily C protein CydC
VALGRIKAISLQPAGGLSGTKTLLPGTVEIDAHNLSFAYQSGQPSTLSGISFNLPPGRKLAVVGASGAGKSTLTGLILRFWDYNEGALLVNGVDTRDYAPETVRQAISVVSQDTYLFNTTIRENIMLARPEATEAEFKNAIDGAMLGELIDKLPHGLETMTGQNGLALSGGERQRIALARALLKAAPVWLLDEPTAGLDAYSEGIIMEKILQAAGSRSIMLITHRLIGLETMDEILVLDGGRVAEHGTLPELLALEGDFYRMWVLERDLLNIT